jgi:hypothetical protein
MDATLRERLQSFLRPHYQDLDGASRSDDAERIGAIARRLTEPSRELELLILFHPLGSWLEKLGNLSRVLLAVGGVNENELRRTAASIRRLDAPESEAERAIAAAILIDAAGVRGLAERLSRSRREGHSIIDVVTAEPPAAPEWMNDTAREWLAQRTVARAEFSRAILDELNDDHVRSTPARS